MVTLFLLCSIVACMVAGLAFGQLYLNRMNDVWDKRSAQYYIGNRVSYILAIVLFVFMVVGVIFHWW